VRYRFVNSLRGRPIPDSNQPLEAYLDGEDVSHEYAQKLMELYAKRRESARTHQGTDTGLAGPRGVQGGPEDGVRVRKMVVLRE
jgi:hypothetical protein